MALVLGAGAVAWLILKTKSDNDSASIFNFKGLGSKYDIPPNLLKAIAKVESGLNPSAVSKPNSNGTRDYGLMQINSKTFQKMGVDISLWLNAEKNIETACKYLASTKRELGDLFSLETWVSSYNIGVPTLKRVGIVNPGYTGKVLFYYNLYNL